MLPALSVSGRGRGVGLGFPTANIEPEKELLPPAGIYAAFVDGGRKTLYGEL